MFIILQVPFMTLCFPSKVIVFQRFRAFIYFKWYFFNIFLRHIFSFLWYVFTNPKTFQKLTFEFITFGQINFLVNFMMQ